jgi:uncharacterized protein YcaQ
VTVHELSRTDARRIAVRAQLLDGTRPAALHDVVRQLTLLQLDPVADRKAGVLRVNAIHQDVPFTRTMTAAVDREIRDLAGWLGLEVLPAVTG